MSFKEALRRKDFVVTAELPLSPESTKDSILADASLLQESVDGYLLTDNQYGQPHMSPLAAASILLHDGFDPILQLSCRNHNRIGLLGELLGARAIGAESLMLVRGGVLPEGYKPRPKAVMDTDAKDLIATVKIIEEDNKFATANDFLIGAAASVHDPAPDWQPEELLAKTEAGAQLIITQVCLDTGVLRRYMECLVSHKLVRRISIVVSIAAMMSAEMADWLRNNRQGTIVPDASVEQLRQAENPATEGIELCARTVREITDIPGISGVNFVVTGDLDIIPEILALSGLRH